MQLEALSAKNDSNDAYVQIDRSWDDCCAGGVTCSGLYSTGAKGAICCSDTAAGCGMGVTSNLDGVAVRCKRWSFGRQLLKKFY